VRITGCQQCIGRLSVRDALQSINVVTTLYLELIFPAAARRAVRAADRGLPRIDYAMESHPRRLS
jgi:hypothetical protein